MSVEEHSAAHRVPGEGLGERLGARGLQDRRYGPSDAFYARFGLRSPWVPEGPVGGASRDFGMVYLSSAAFLDHMASLADKREARIARYDGIGRRVNRRKPSALRRAGGRVRTFSTWGNVGVLGDGDIVLPEHPEMQAAETDENVVPRSPGRVRGPSMRPVSSPWLSFKSRPAQVFGGTHRAAAASSPESATGAPTLSGRPQQAAEVPVLAPGVSPSIHRSAGSRRVRPSIGWPIGSQQSRCNRLSGPARYQVVRTNWRCPHSVRDAEQRSGRYAGRSVRWPAWLQPGWSPVSPTVLRRR